MVLNGQSFVTNIALSKIKLDKPVTGLDFFKISGLPLYPPELKYREAGRIRFSLSRKYGVPMAEYYSPRGNVFIVSDLSLSRIMGESEEINGTMVEYTGKGDIEPDEMGRKTLIALQFFNR